MNPFVMVSYPPPYPRTFPPFNPKSHHTPFTRFSRRGMRLNVLSCGASRRAQPGPVVEQMAWTLRALWIRVSTFDA